MNIVIILTLLYMFGLFISIVIWLTKCSRKERLKRLKNYKHGWFVFIYFAAIPLFFLAQSYNGQNTEEAIWLSVRACFEVVVLRIDFATITPLLTKNLLYHIAIEVLLCFITLNMLMFTLAFCGQWLFNRISFFFIRKLGKKIVVVIGTSKNALDILDTIPKDHKALLFGKLTPKLKEDAYICKAATYFLKDADNLGVLFEKFFGNLKKRHVSVIMELEDDEKSLLYVEQFSTFIKSSGLTEIPLINETGLNVFVFISMLNKEIFANYTETSNGIIQFVNRHNQISTDFIDRYPLTQFMTEREIDYSTATIRDKIELNVFMIGFGKLNESLFLTSVSNNQFLTIKEKKLHPKPVTYHIYDRYYPQGKFTKSTEVYSSNLHHRYFRYHEFLKLLKNKKEEFLECVPMPAKIVKHAIETTHPRFYTSIQPLLLNKNSFNYIIVSFGTDMENIELAEKLQQKICEWEIKTPIKIFVKVRDTKMAKTLCNDSKNIFFFGANRDCVYNAEIILREKINRMARWRHILYTAEDIIKKKNHLDLVTLNDKTIQEEARKKWYSFEEYRRESNSFACLSIRMKLQLCGYDYAEFGKDCTTEYLETYEKNDKRIPYKKSDKCGSDFLKVFNKKIWKYTNTEQFRHSLRWTLAVQEHLRWCANLIVNGFIPCSKQEILTLDKDELLKKRKHGNLTTMEGLVEFRKLVMKATGKTEEEIDVIRYDYQLMDDIDWLLKQCGYILIKKKLL